MRADMADTSPANLKAHEQTYDGFLRLLKFGTVASLLLAALVVYLIAS